MISLRKHIDNYNPQEENQNDPGMPDAILSEFRALLLAIGQGTNRAVPSLGLDIGGMDIGRKMTLLQEALVRCVTAGLLTKTSRQARDELSQWADRAFSHHQDIERELREVVCAVSSAAESVRERDGRYVTEIGDLTGCLGSIAKETDLVHLRRSLVESTRALKSCVARMAEDSEASVQQLTSQVKEYRARLEKAERASNTDPLTNLANRRAFEKHLGERIAARGPFCLIMIDLDDFKGVNDRYGHIAGDDLLKQFAAELHAQFTPADMVGRWGGDEFIVVVGGHLSNAEGRIGRLRNWALGEYQITQGDRRVKILLRASIGVAEWDGNESGTALLARVDREGYRAKEIGKRVRVQEA
jgi:diguanylate cyclase (GGDEF)-like protein